MSKQLVVMMGSTPAKVWTDKLVAGGVNAVAGTAAFEADALPSQTDGVIYLISKPLADKVRGTRSDCYQLPLDASSNSPDSFGIDWLVKVQ